MSVCGLPLSLSVTVSVPVRAPVAVGVKVRLMVHVPPLAAIDVHPLFCTLKSPFVLHLEVTLVRSGDRDS